VHELAKRTGKLDLSAALSKSKTTQRSRILPGSKKVNALVGSVTVEKTKVGGKSIVVVDDLYQSGSRSTTSPESARGRSQAGLWLGSVKTLRNDDNVPKTAESPQTDDDLNDEDLF